MVNGYKLKKRLLYTYFSPASDHVLTFSFWYIMSREAWVSHCFSGFTVQLKHYIYKLSDNSIPGITKEGLLARKSFCPCDYMNAYNLKLIPNSLTNIILYHGYYNRRGILDPMYYYHKYAFVIVIPGKDICIMGVGPLSLRCVQKFKNEMADNLKTDALLRYKRFVLGEDIDFESEM